MARRQGDGGKAVFGLGSRLRKRRYQDNPGFNPKAGGTTEQFLDFLTASSFTGGMIGRPEDLLRVPTISACVNLIAGSISRLPIQLVRRNGDIIDRLPPFFRQLNPDEPIERTLDALVRGLLLHGNSYLIVESWGRGTDLPTAAYVPPIDQVSISEYYSEERGVIASIHYRGQELNPPITALHFALNRRPGYLRGRGMWAEHWGTANTALALRQWTRQLMETGAMPHLWAKVPQGSSAEYVEKVKASVKQLLENRERSVPVSGDVDIQTLQIKPVDVELLAIKDDIDRDLIRPTGISPHRVGVKMESGKTYSNVTAENRNLVDDALMPIISILEAGLSQWAPKGQSVRFDVSQIVRPTLPERVKAHQAAGGNKPWMTIGEIRKAEGLPEIDEEELQPAAPPPQMVEEEEEEEGEEQEEENEETEESEEELEEANA